MRKNNVLQLFCILCGEFFSFVCELLKILWKAWKSEIVCKSITQCKKIAIFSTKSVRKMEIMGLCKNVVPTIT